ncbi:MAG: transferase [Candidatus Omnitrophica bacterium]|nr:transferase [Candidatus Omnitrophota bacterium]
MRRVIILGCGNFGQTVHHFFVHDSDYEVVGFTVDEQFLETGSFLGLPVVAFEEVQERFPPDDHDLFVAVGLRDLNRQRAAKVKEAEAKGYHLATYISSRATVPPGLELGPNSWIMEASHVHPYASIGRDVIIWSRSTVGFKSRVNDHCWISAGLLGDAVAVGEGTFIGLGATVASFVAVGRHNVIGAGALILKDTKDFQIYRGHGSAPSRVPSTRFAKFNG